MDYFFFTQLFPYQFLYSENISSSRMSFRAVLNYHAYLFNMNFCLLCWMLNWISSRALHGWVLKLCTVRLYYCWQSFDLCGCLSCKTCTSQPRTDQRHQHPWAAYRTLPGQCCSSAGALICLRFVLIVGLTRTLNFTSVWFTTLLVSACFIRIMCYTDPKGMLLHLY